MKLLAFVLAAVTTTVYAGNNFAGIGASNSNGNRGSYTCRTQDDVRLFTLLHFPDFRADLYSTVELDCLKRQRSRISYHTYNWL